MTYITGFIDPRSEHTRKELRKRHIRDFDDKSLRWGLHLSEEEAYWLECNNPDTLGCPDYKLRQGYWKHFMSDNASIPYRVQEKI
jgi:hypothetical protein